LSANKFNSAFTSLPNPKSESIDSSDIYLELLLRLTILSSIPLLAFIYQIFDIFVGWAAISLATQQHGCYIKNVGLTKEPLAQPTKNHTSFSP